MPIRLPKLPYAPDALAPAISGNAVRYHYEHHHGGYVKAVNRLVKSHDLKRATLDKIIKESTGPLANVAAQVWNHTFFWQSMTPRVARPDTALIRAIDQSFGSRAALARRFRKEALGLFGSGWVWLVATDASTLDVLATPNAGLRLHEENYWPLLVCDVWEHAYYIDYRGDRAGYVDAFWHVANWQTASERLAVRRTLNRNRGSFERDLRRRQRAVEDVQSWHAAVAHRSRAEMPHTSSGSPRNV